MFPLSAPATPEGPTGPSTPMMVRWTPREICGVRSRSRRCSSTTSISGSLAPVRITTIMVFLLLVCINHICARRTQCHGLAQIDMPNLLGGALGVGEQQHANASLDALFGHGNLAGAEKGALHPAKLARGKGGVLGVQVVADGEEDGGDVVWLDLVAPHEPL